MYVCGPTVYSPSHIGHMVGPVIFDTIKRFIWSTLATKATWVVNITDVDDKLIVVKAQKDGTTVNELAERDSRATSIASLRLGVDGIDHMHRRRPSTSPENCCHQSGGSIEQEFAYESAGDVYFNVGKAPEYGKLAPPRPRRPSRRGPGSSPPRSSATPATSPCGRGPSPASRRGKAPGGRDGPAGTSSRSAMSMKYLGRHFDIHGGGLDLVFPHHENELVQSESFTGETFTTYWLHNGLLTKDGKKISKSDPATIVLMSDLLKAHNADTLRALLLSSHYRRPIDFGPNRLDEIERGLQTFYRAFERFAELLTGERFDQLAAPLRRNEFAQGRFPLLKEIAEHRTGGSSMPPDDDFNTGGAIGELFQNRARPEPVCEPASCTGPGARAREARLSEPSRGGHGRAQRAMPDPRVIQAPPTDRRTSRSCSERRIDGSAGRPYRARLRKEKNFALADEVQEAAHGHRA